MLIYLVVFCTFCLKDTFVVPLFNTWETVNRNIKFYSRCGEWSALCLCETCGESDKRIV